MNAIVVTRTGGPEELRLQQVPIPEPQAGQAVVRVTAIGVNYVDTYHRSGLYPLPLPFVPGVEAVGVVESVADDVSGISTGDRAGWVMSPGAYAQYALVNAAKLVAIPESIQDDQAAAALLQGMTAHYLTRTTFPLKQGDIALVHAAAGGAGLLITQMAKAQGARVIGTTSTQEKADLAREAGADDIILYTEDDFELEVKKLTGNRGVDVVYDSVGATTFAKSLKCIRPRGMMVSFGQSSGSVPPFDALQLQTLGSLFLTRPSLAHYTSDPVELKQRAQDVFQALQSGALRLRIEKSFPLAEAAEAHRALESRKTSGKLLLIPA